MTDDRTSRAPEDRSRVRIDSQTDIEYWTNRFGVGEDRLRAAVGKVGNEIDLVAAELNG